MISPILLLHGSSSLYGADRELYAIATGLDRSRFAPIVVLPEPGPLADRLREAGVEIYYAPLAVLSRRLLQGRGALSTARLLSRNRRELGAFARRREIALVHSNTSILLSGQVIADEARVPHVLHVREIFRGTGGHPGRVLWPLYRRRLARADVLACVSKAVASQFNGSTRTQVVYTGLARSDPLPPRALARRELGVASDAFVVAVVGRISDWKGQRILARALADPKLAAIDAVGLIAGDVAPGQERYERELVGLRARLGLGDRLRLLGFRDDVATVFAASDIVAVPSVWEDPLPQAALEATALGLPVVATDRGGLPEIIRDGRTGRIVPGGDHVALAAALRDLADDPQRARELGAAAAADVRARFDTQRMLADLQGCYEELTR
jgi:glycosyltransferase involved in cell wall biosynthesis